MERVLWAVLLPIALALVASGCQSQNPFAAVGPVTVPAPSTGQPLPYYPPNVSGGAPAASGAAGSATAGRAKSPRVSVSAEGTATSPSRTAIVADPADREPIRIVESNSPAVRTANANTRGGAGSATGAATVPSGNIQPPPNRVPASPLPANGQSGYAPAGTSPATSRMRGFGTTVGDAKSIPGGVAPASYSQPVPTFSEATAADGQWRAR